VLPRSWLGPGAKSAGGKLVPGPGLSDQYLRQRLPSQLAEKVPEPVLEPPPTPGLVQANQPGNLKVHLAKFSGIQLVRVTIKNKWAMGHARRVLENGQTLGMFPEGTRNKGRGLAVAKTGTARMAIEAKSPIVPMVLVGTGSGSHYENFIGALRSGNRKDLTCDIEVGYMSTALPHLANISYRLGRKLTFDGCKEKFLKDPEKYFEKFQDENILLESVQKKCPVMGGDINKEVYIDYKGRRIYFCCAGCEEKFMKEPEKYLKKIE